VHRAVVRLLLEKGVDVESRDTEGRTPLWLAVRNGHEAVVRLLLEKSVDVDSKNAEGRTPLWLTVQNRYEAVVRLLLEKGVDVESRDTKRLTPLLYGFVGDHETSSQYSTGSSSLLEKGLGLLGSCT
jgi:ankyrin repeat protein